MKKIKIIIISFFVLFSSLSFATGEIFDPTNPSGYNISDIMHITTPTANNSTPQPQDTPNNLSWDYGHTIASVFDKAIPAIKKGLNSVLVTKQNIVLKLFLMLFIIDSIYLFTTHFVEGRYESIASNLIMRAFFGAMILALLDNFAILSIIQEITSFIFKESTLNFSTFPSLKSWYADGQTSGVMAGVTSPLLSVDTMLSNIWQIVYGTQGKVLNKVFIMLIILPCSVTMYVIAAKVTLSLFLKSVEWAIGTSVSLVGLAGYGSQLTQKYSSNSLQYLIATAIDYIGTVFMFTLGLNVINSTVDRYMSPAMIGSLGINGLLDVLISFIVFSALVKIGPDIIGGLMSGAPGITPGHSSALVSAVGGMGGGAGKMAMGGTKMIAGAAKGGVAGAIGGATKALRNGGGIRDVLGSATTSAAIGAAKEAGRATAKTIGSVGAHLARNHAGHEFNNKHTGLQDVYKQIFKTFDDKKNKNKKDEKFNKTNSDITKKINGLEHKIGSNQDKMNDLEQEINNINQDDLKYSPEDKAKILKTKNSQLKKLQKSQQKMKDDIKKLDDNYLDNHNLDINGQEPTLTLKELSKLKNPKWRDIQKMSLYDIEQYYKNKEK